MYTLSKILLDTLAEIGRLMVRTATSGSVGSVLDAELAGEYQEDDWQNGIIVIVSNDGLAPEGEFAAISSYEPQSGAFTLAQELSAPVGAGTRYGLAPGRFPLQICLRMLNRGLNRLGQISLCEEVSLAALESGKTIASFEWDHPGPTGIEFCLSSGEWRRLFDWYYIPAQDGGSGQVRMRVSPAAISELRIWYRGRHPELLEYDDCVSPSIPPDLAVAAAVERLLHWQYFHNGGTDPVSGMLWKEAQQELYHLRRRMPVMQDGRQARLGSTRYLADIQRGKI